jgi:hypothetical protein
MKAWQIAAALVGIGVIMVIIRNMQTSKAQLSTGATSNDVILGLSKFGSGLLDLGGKIFTPGANQQGGDYGPGSSVGTSLPGGGIDYGPSNTAPSWGDSGFTG